LKPKQSFRKSYKSSTLDDYYVYDMEDEFSAEEEENSYSSEY